MKKLSLVFVLLAGLMLLNTACGGNKQRENEQSNSLAIETISVDSLLANADSFVDKEVALSGLCTHICSHGAKKIFLMGSDDTKTIRVEAKEELGAFKQECVNSNVLVRGELKEERIDEAYLSDWEKKIAEETEEEHGEGDGAGCATEKKARNEGESDSSQERIKDFRERIAERKASEGKEYLSFYYIECSSYEIQ